MGRPKGVKNSKEPQPRKRLDRLLRRLLDPKNPKPRAPPKPKPAKTGTPSSVSSTNRHRRSISQTYEQWLVDPDIGTKTKEVTVSRGPFKQPPIPNSWLHSYKTRHNQYVHRKYPWLQHPFEVEDPEVHVGGLAIEKMREQDEAGKEGAEVIVIDESEDESGDEAVTLSEESEGDADVDTEEEYARPWNAWKWVSYDPLLGEDVEEDSDE